MMEHRRRLSSQAGVTMLEMLMVVAMIGILSAVVFINVIRYQRGLNQLERDNVAKEIFVAAQNHLTVAMGEGYGNVNESGSQIVQDTGDSSTSSGIYMVVYPENSYTNSNTSILDLMLPFGSLDETVRLGGSYIITYQKKTGLVQDVFYTSTNASPENYNHTLTAGDYKTLISNYAGDDNRNARRSCKIEGEPGEPFVLGWYGGAKAAELDKITLKAPSIEIDNGNKLTVTVTDPNAEDSNLSGKYTLKLYVTGKKSGAQKIIEIGISNSRVTKDSNGNYVIVLDDITKKDMHFADLGSDNEKDFYWGEDIEVQAVVSSTSALATEKKSDRKTTNSLFGDVEDGTASINNFRHLENLDKDVSSNSNIETGTSTEPIGPTKAKQSSDMNWDDFVNDIGVSSEGGKKTITIYDSNTEPTTGYRPVNTDNLEYDGDGHKVSNVSITDPNVTDAGMFGQVTGGTIKNLELVDFSVTGSENAGALAAETYGVSVENILVYNSNGTETKITAKNNAGGLIGLMEGGSVIGCGAAVTVGDPSAPPISAGGLIGQATSLTSGSAGTGTSANPVIQASYAGGHTENGTYDERKDNSGNTLYDVTGNTAGGLVGTASNATIQYSYSTCSVEGSTGSAEGSSESGTAITGGFVGKAEETVVNYSYSTGLVSGSGDNAFVGSGSLASRSSNNMYCEIINEVTDENGTITYKGPGDKSVTAFDSNASTLNEFMQTPGVPARAYDDTLVERYQGTYSFPTVGQLVDMDMSNTLTDVEKRIISSSKASTTHYGDWPSPETLVLNEKSTTT